MPVVARLRQFLSRALALGLVSVLVLGAAGCSGRPPAISLTSEAPVLRPEKRGGQIAEVSPPTVIPVLRQALADYQPQVRIVSPKADEVMESDRVEVRLRVTDLPLFKDPKLGLGPNIEVFLDDQPYQSVFNPDEPLVFENLSAGSHTLRALAAQPWHESFKNDGAYAQTTFHVFTPTRAPDPDLPLLTYGSPQGSYGAEPILLDFFLSNAPLHLVAEDETEVADWKIRCTINGESFMLDRWQPIYLTGFKKGKNWLKLEYLDENGEPVENLFNTGVRIIDYQPGGEDALSRLVRDRLPVEAAMALVKQGVGETAKVFEETPKEIEPSNLEPAQEADSLPVQQDEAESTGITPVPIPPALVAPSVTSPVESPVEPPVEVPVEVPVEMPEAIAPPQAEKSQKPKGGFFSRFSRKSKDDDKASNGIAEPTVAPAPESVEKPSEEAARAQSLEEGTSKAEAAEAEAKRAAAEKAEAQRLEAEKAEAERLEAEQLEAERLEAERLEAERIAAEKAEAERLEAERLEAEAQRLEAKKAEAERVKAAEAEAKAERLAAEQAEAKRIEAERIEAGRIEAGRIEAERIEAERTEAERLKAEQAEAERIEAEKLQAEQERIAAEKAETDRIAAETAEAERIAAEQAEAERVAVQKAEAERVAAEKAEAKRLKAEQRQAEQAEAARLKAEQAEVARVKAEEAKAEKARIQAEKKADRERIRAEKKAEKERLKQERAARIQAQKEQAAQAKAEQAKAEQEARAAREDSAPNPLEPAIPAIPTQLSAPEALPAEAIPAEPVPGPVKTDKPGGFFSRFGGQPSSAKDQKQPFWKVFAPPAPPAAVELPDFDQAFDAFERELEQTAPEPEVQEQASEVFGDGKAKAESDAVNIFGS